MPLYEYLCRRCAKRFELLVRSSRARASCPHCKGKKLQRLFSVFGMSTGSGFRASPSSDGRNGGGCGSCGGG
jgi:putative FmdB family regulatory protein